MFPSLLRPSGVLGLNARNLLYVRPYNPRKAVAFADDKLKTKAFLSARGVPTAKLFARIESRRQLRAFDFSTLPDECVLKPNYGYGGEGIIVMKGRKNGSFLRMGKDPIPMQDLREHIEDILDGKFSVNGRDDTAFFEQILVPDDRFRPLRPAGLPDIRVIVFNLVPVMAMLRLPTAESGGKANVHLGGIGIGIDLSKGVTTHGCQYHGMIERLPHGHPVAGFTIPHWNDILQICSRIQYITNIGYLAADVTIDRHLGPVLLEVNARAGLMVQVANLAPLRSRLERVEGLTVASPEKGVLLGQELFGSSKTSKRSSDDRTVIAMHESVEFSGENATVSEPCLIDVDTDESSADPQLLRELVEQGIVRSHDVLKDGSMRLKFSLCGRKVQTAVRPETMRGTRFRIGRRDLAGFLIDPSQRSTKLDAPRRIQATLKALDRQICAVDRSLALLRMLRPTNLEEERARALQDPSYNPVLHYAPLREEVLEQHAALARLPHDPSPLGQLLSKKIVEIDAKVSLLRSRGNSAEITTWSTALFGNATDDLQQSARSALASEGGATMDSESSEIGAVAAKRLLEEALEEYGLHEWNVKILDGMVTDCAVGTQSVLLRRRAKFDMHRLQALIAHEIETHVLTSENATMQPYEIFRQGFAGSTESQEGLAIWNQQRVLPPGHAKRRRHAENVLAAAVAEKGSFSDVRSFLRDECGMRDMDAVSKAFNVKRGLCHTAEPGCFTRVTAYHRGYRSVCSYLSSGGPEKDLYIGKIFVPDLPIIRAIDGIVAPLMLPRHLRSLPK